MIHDNHTHHDSRNAIISGPVSDRDRLNACNGARPKPEPYLLKGQGFRRTNIYEEGKKPIERRSLYIENADRQILYVASKTQTWADVYHLQQTLFPAGFVVLEVNGNPVQTTYPDPNKKPVTVTGKKSRKIKWP